MSWLISVLNMIWNIFTNFFYVDVYVGKQYFIEYGDFIEMKTTIFNNSNGLIKITEFESKYNIYEHSIIIDLDNENSNDIFEVKYPNFIGDDIQPKQSKEIYILFRNKIEIKNIRISLKRIRYLRNYPLYKFSVQ